MHFARLSGLDDQAGRASRPDADQVMVDRRGGRSAGGDPVLVGAVGQDKDVPDAFARRLPRRPADSSSTCSMPCGPGPAWNVVSLT